MINQLLKNLLSLHKDFIIHLLDSFNIMFLQDLLEVSIYINLSF
jgi:hypothetical protein